MTEKDNVSMATVQMKADYAASEVYSTASEPPPAYKRQANSVKIAKITAFTIIVSSFILGAFILASSYLQAKASCDQVQALDSVLEKELMLETLQQVNKELPRAEALLGKENSDETDLQNLEKEEAIKKTDYKPQAAVPPTSNEEEMNENDNSFSEGMDNDEMSKFPGKVPLELDLSDLAATLLKNNKKSRMNCVVERKHAEEIVDSPSKTVAFPFGLNLRTDPKKARITGERISIFCDGGDDSKEQESRNNREEADNETDDDAEQIRPMFIPFQRGPMLFGRIPQQFPLTHMPQRMMPPAQLQQQPQQPQHQIPQQPMMRQMPPLPPFHQLPMRPPMPPQIMQAPQPEQQTRNMIFGEPQQQTVRIHVQQIPFREFQVQRPVPVPVPSSYERQEMPQFQIHRVPLNEVLEKVGLTAEDLLNVQRMAEERITNQLKNWIPEDDDEDDSSNSDEASNSNSENSNETEQSVSRTSSEEQARQQSVEQQNQQQQQQQQPQESQQEQQESVQQPEPRQQPEETEQPMMPQRERLILQPLPEQPSQNQMSPMSRVAFGRSLANPVRIPVPMMQAQADASNEESERPHILQPRSSSFK